MSLYAQDLAEYPAAGLLETPLTRQLDFSALPGFVTPRQSIVLDRNSLISRGLVRAYNDAARAGFPVSGLVRELAPRFIQILPDELPYAEPYISYAGTLCLDWDELPACQLSLMLQATGRVSYAAFFSGEKVNGSGDFSRASLPQGLLDVASRWLQASGRSPV